MSDEPRSNESPGWQARCRRWGFGGVLGIASLWLIGQVARDRLWLTGLCFYIPSPVMAMIGLAATLLQGLRSDRRRALALGLVTLAPAALTLFIENRWWPRPVPAHSTQERVRLAHWNIGYGDWGLAGAEQELVRQKAAIYVLSELPRDYDLDALAAQLGPDHRPVRMGSMAVIATGRLFEPTRLVNERDIKVNSVRWESQGRTLKVFAVDLTSALDVARDPLLRRVRALMVEEQPDLLAGDLNAPRRSRWLSPLPEGFAHAYDAAGHGWSSTWPVGLPLYAIDQCIVSPSIIPLKYQLISTRFSDHRMQTLDFLIAPPRKSSRGNQ